MEQKFFDTFVSSFCSLFFYEHKYKYERMYLYSSLAWAYIQTKYGGDEIPKIIFES